MADPNWAEVVTAVATAVGGDRPAERDRRRPCSRARQVREAERGRHSDVAAEFLRRWDEDVSSRRRHRVAQYRTPKSCRDAVVGFIETNSVQAFVLYRELDFFEQLAALEQIGAFDFELIRLLLGRRLVERWEMAEPSIDAMGADIYPLFGALAGRMRTAFAEGDPT